MTVVTTGMMRADRALRIALGAFAVFISLLTFLLYGLKAGWIGYAALPALLGPEPGWTIGILHLVGVVGLGIAALVGLATLLVRFLLYKFWGLSAWGLGWWTVVIVMQLIAIGLVPSALS